MRVIKFRGLRTDGKGWVVGYYRKNTFYNKLGDSPKEIYTKHFIGAFDNIDLFDGIFEQVEVHPETVGQFTGLLDKNGVEIYEHDKLDNEEVVTWSIEQGCYFAGHSPLCMSASHREVIGNIHELTT
jgi:hypothetical protein